MIVLITAVIPFVTAAVKKILKTDKWGEKKSGWNALLCNASHNSAYVAYPFM